MITRQIARHRNIDGRAIIQYNITAGIDCFLRPASAAGWVKAKSPIAVDSTSGVKIKRIVERKITNRCRAIGEGRAGTSNQLLAK